MRADDSAIAPERVAARRGAVLAALGVASFSFTFPATSWALEGFGPWTTTALRCALAGLVAAAVLKGAGARLPDRRHIPGLLVVALGCVVAFPLLTSLALQTTSTGNAAVIIGLLPMSTAVVSSLWSRSWPPGVFWVAAAVGAAAVAGFTAVRTGGAPGPGDLYLFAALVLCAAGYAAGGRLSAHMPGWQVIAWALVLSMPVMVPAAAVALPLEPVALGPVPIAGMVYLALVSQFGGFAAWYRGMALIGVARASQFQLAQPLLTLVWAFLVLGEAISAWAPVTALVVLVCIAVTQRAARRRAAPAPQAAPGSTREDGAQEAVSKSG
ncbi:DMT family transporter [Nocardiopsis suaedae]|uniref:DMT family transporter n=1 Tax=Nocardiopsis suaedae TaxID=3018444 RepID=A0ABT4THG4_9ACTN|nr:DMT family transporter [Nocardiopsis suaedae]MDA2804145.1 DMT family transporter [Nocardiopsis suaedae]